MEVLFFNSAQIACGVYQYGLRLYTILAKWHKQCLFTYAEVDSLDAYIAIALSSTAKVHLFNYNCTTMPWLNLETICPTAVNVGIPHESSWNLSKWIIDTDPADLSLGIPRPLFETCPRTISDYCPKEIRQFIEYTEYTGTGSKVPIFGSFGFGCNNKGFHRIVEKVNAEYDRAVIKFVIPVAHYDPLQVTTVMNACRKCEIISRKSGIKLMFNHSFLSTEDLLIFLSSNTMNVFMYDTQYGRVGISSVIDYALSVGIPIAISDSYLFRHIYREDICAYTHTLAECMESNFISSIKPKENNKALVRILERRLHNILARASQS